MSTTAEGANELMADIQRFAPLFQAYLECSDQLQAQARKLFATLADPQADADDRALAAMTLADILVPDRHKGGLVSDLKKCEALAAQHSPEARETLERMDREERPRRDPVPQSPKEAHGGSSWPSAPSAGVPGETDRQLQSEGA